ncbi:uncharacterized protein C8Q71DRAFT_818035 [Rhodofomes roseus]|uniref:BTB domain-containing protein n=1 Tax=Rhodofomes roseus TaxID=34475 RepID=A0ABQ8JZZ9_9APHY|nr:uncharacterized protein C8Q71DRAFT_818035 [Rhodofomes roseus]KAH9829965.1 hypothetical protein C8Q71DRAFT_818035 [Rhodofomes roseus]
MSDPSLSHHPSSRSLRERLATRERSPVISTVPLHPAEELPAEEPPSIQEGSAAAPIATACDDGELVRHHDLWFSDGSIVLRAENVLFRVHISQLSRHSTVFADMLEFPQPAGTPSSDAGGDGEQGERIDGCPVLFLHDKAEDVMNLLHALYDGPSFGDNGREDFRAVSGILRLANKYDIEKLRSTAVDHLSTAWPMTLRAWDLREDLARTYEIETGMQRGFRYPSPVAIINLAREVDAPHLLPSAFYDLSRYHYAQVFGTVPGEPDDHEPLGAGSPRASTLAHADIQKLAVGKEAAAHAVTWLIQSMAHGSHGDSPRHLAEAGAGGQFGFGFGACRKDFGELVELATQHYLFDRERGCADPLYVAEELGQLKSAEFSECKACARSLEGWAARERERMWKMIPVWFRLTA